MKPNKMCPHIQKEQQTQRSAGQRGVYAINFHISYATCHMPHTAPLIHVALFTYSYVCDVT